MWPSPQNKEESSLQANKEEESTPQTMGATSLAKAGSSIIDTPKKDAGKGGLGEIPGQSIRID